MIRFGMDWSARERLGLADRLTEIEKELCRDTRDLGVYRDWWDEVGRDLVLKRTV